VWQGHEEKDDLDLNPRQEARKRKTTYNVGPLWRKDKDKPRRAETAPKKKYYK
jgi:hypothetical protein